MSKRIKGQTAAEHGGHRKVLALRFKRHFPLILTVSLLSTASAALCQKLDWLGINDSETSAYDQGLTTFTRKVEKSKDIVIVAIDDRSFQEIAHNQSYQRNFGAWPYSRNIWARIFDHLKDEGAKAVVFDAMQDEPHPDPSGDLAMGQTILDRKVPYYVGFNVVAEKNAPLPKVEPKNRLPSDVFEKAPPAPPPPVEAKAAPPAEFPAEFPSEPAATGAAAASSGPAGYPQVTPEEVATALAFPVEANGIELPDLKEPDEAVQNGEPRMRYPVPPIAPLIPVTSGFGIVLPEEDGDGKMRRTHFAYTDGVNTYVTLSVAVAADLFQAEKLELSPRLLKLGRRQIAINPEGDAEINYGGRLDKRFTAVSLVSVLNDWAEKAAGKPARLPKGFFQDKVVLIAGFAAGTADMKGTPFSSLSPGVAKHAAEIQSFIDGVFITNAPYWVSLLLTFLVAFLSIAVIIVVESTPLEIIWPLFLYFGFFLITGGFLVLTKVHVLSAMPSMAGEFASVTAVAFNHFFASKERDRIRDAFSRYLDPSVAELVAESKPLPRLEGETREVTAFFSDIRGFTSFTEKYRDKPDVIIRMLNEYLTRVTLVLQRHLACVDKYIGDAVVALFGAPVNLPDHPLRACRAALAIRDEVAAMREEFEKKGLPDVYTRIGINTAKMFVGNFGSQQILDYTAMGDGMNLASRLEGVNKKYETSILIGQSTYEAAKDGIEAREVDSVRVAGRQEPVAIYELLGLKGQLPELKRRTVELYQKALGHYRKAQFQEACSLLQQALASDQADGPSRVLLSRCEAIGDTPPDRFDPVVSLEK